MNDSFYNRLKKGRYKILLKLLIGKILFSSFLAGSYLFYRQHNNLQTELSQLKSKNIQKKH